MFIKTIINFVYMYSNKIVNVKLTHFGDLD